MADRDVTVGVKANTAAYDSALLRSAALTKKFATEGRSAGASLDQIGRTAGRVGLIAAAGLGVMVVASARFDKSMSAVQAATHETADNMDLLRQAAIKAGADTAFSATEAAAGIEELAKAGVSTADILGGGLRGALDLAAAGTISVGDAAEFTATALSQFKLSGAQATHVADLLAAGAGKAQGGVSDMALALNYAGVPAAQLGVSIEETSGAIALLASNGILGQKAGTGLRGVLSSLASPSAAAAKTLEAYNIQLFDSQGKFIGLAGVADQLKMKLGGLTEEERANALGKIFSNAQLNTANILLRDGAAGIEDWTAAVNDQGYAAETAALKLDNLAGDVEKFKGSLETALITAGSGSQGPLRQLVQGATGAVNAFNQMPAPLHETITGMLGITAITGGGLWFGSKVIRSVADTREALKTLGVEAGKSGTIMRGIGKGIEFVAILEGINLIDKAFDNLFDSKFEDSSLNRDLEALTRGEVVDNLDKIGVNLRNLNQGGLQVSDKLFGWLPGSTTLDEAADNVEKLDQALAGMVESGNAEMASEVFRKAMEQAVAEGVSIEDVTKSFDDYGVAVRNATIAAALHDEATRDNIRSVPLLGAAVLGEAAAQDASADATKKSGNAHELTAKQVKKLKDAYLDEVKAARDVAHQFVNLTDAVDDNKVSLNQWIRDLAKQAAALRDFRLNAQEAADKGLRQGLIDALEEAGPAGALRMKQLANATDEQIARANRAWQAGKREIDKYIEATTQKPKLLVENDQALAEIREVRDALQALHDKAIELRVNHVDNYIETHPGTGGGGGDPRKTGGGTNRRGSMLSPAARGFATTVLPTIDLTNVDIKGLRDALRGFAVDVDMGAASVASEVDQLRRSLREAGGVWTMNLERQAQALIDTAEKYDAAAASLERLQQASDAFRDAVANSFNTDVISGNLAQLGSGLSGDIANIDAMKQTLALLAAAGLDTTGDRGALYAELAKSGNLSLAQQLLASGASGVDYYEGLFAQRALDQQGFASGQQQTVYGQEMREQTLATYELRTQMEKQEVAFNSMVKSVEGIGRHVKSGTKEGSYEGTYKGVKDAASGAGLAIARSGG